MHCQTTSVSNIIAVYYERFALVLFGVVLSLFVSSLLNGHYVGDLKI